MVTTDRGFACKVPGTELFFTEYGLRHPVPISILEYFGMCLSYIQVVTVNGGQAKCKWDQREKKETQTVTKMAKRRRFKLFNSSIRMPGSVGVVRDRPEGCQRGPLRIRYQKWYPCECPP